MSGSTSYLPKKFKMQDVKVMHKHGGKKIMTQKIIGFAWPVPPMTSVMTKRGVVPTEVMLSHNLRPISGILTTTSGGSHAPTSSLCDIVCSFIFLINRKINLATL